MGDGGRSWGTAGVLGGRQAFLGDGSVMKNVDGQFHARLSLRQMGRFVHYFLIFTYICSEEHGRKCDQDVLTMLISTNRVGG